MRAIRIFIFLFIFLSSPIFAYGYEESWGNMVVQSQFGDDVIMFDALHRAKGGEYEDPFFTWVRGQYGIKTKYGLLLLGGSYVKFYNSSDEYRLSQYFVKNQTLELFNMNYRLGLEERKFLEDSQWYLRLRMRLRSVFEIPYIVKPALYNELFYVPNGEGKFATGFNENRFGLGIHAKINEHYEFYVFHTRAYLKSLRNESYQSWLQFFVNVSF